MLKKLAAAFLLSLALAQDVPAFTHGSAVGTLPSGFSTLKVGGGGYVTFITRSGSTLYATTDTAGAYVTDGSGIWHQLLTTTSMPGVANGYSGSGQVGTWGISALGSTIYLMRNNIVYGSTNGGGTFAACTNWVSQTAGTGNANGNNRLSGPKILIDPNNASVVLVGTENAGAWYSIDGCANWTKLPSPVPASDSAGYVFVFDQHSGTTSGRTNNVYAMGSSNGVVYKTTGTVTGTWASTGGPSTAIGQPALAYDGTNSILVVSTGATSAFARYNRGGSGAWDTVSGLGFDSNGVTSIAVDPTNEKRVAVTNVSGTSYGVTADISVTTPVWVSHTSVTATPVVDVPWLGYTTNSGYISTSNAGMFDYTGTYFYTAAGVGVWKVNPGAGDINWTSQTAGIENLTSNAATSAPWMGGHVDICSWDRMLQYVVAGSLNYPVQNQLDTTFNSCWDEDYSGTGSVLIALINSYGSGLNPKSAYSADNGQTWTQFPTQPGKSTKVTNAPSASTATALHFGAGNIPASVGVNDIIQDLTTPAAIYTNSPTQVTALNSPSAGDISISIAVQSPGVGSGDNIQFTKPYGGAITASTATNFAYMSNTDSTIFYTTNAGSAWGVSSVTGGPATWPLSNSHILEADKNTTGVFYVYSNNASAGKIYKSTDGGATFPTVTNTSPADLTSLLGGAGGSPSIRTVPGQAGHLYMSNQGHFIRSLDGGVTWTALANCSTGGAFGFGKAAAGHSYPTIFVDQCDGTSGHVYQSIDGDQTVPTFQSIGRTPWLDLLTGLVGDWSVTGQFYYSMSGSTAGGYHP